MSRYEIYLFLHIACAILWVGTGAAVALFAAFATRAKDDIAFANVVATAGYLGQRLFGPTSIGVLVFGILMVADGPWSFDQLWITLGLAGYAFTALTGFLVFEPRTKRINAMVEADDGTMSPEALLEARKMLAITRADQTVLWLVVAVMVLRPTSDDAGLLAVMAVLLVAGLASTRRAIRQIEASASTT